MKNLRIEALDDIDRPLIAIRNDYPPDHVIAPHSHRRAQLLYGARGAIQVTTARGTWVVPPQRAVWIPPGVTHDVRMIGATVTCSLYVEPQETAGLPTICEVFGITPLMRSLMLEAVELPPRYDPETRDGALMALISHEMRHLAVLPLALPLPRQAALLRHCQRFLADPTPHETIDDWAEALSQSRRSFTRLFRRETGLSFAAWRRQACLFAALPRLIEGESVTSVALDLGYDNPAAFTAMFKRSLGTAPSRYLDAGDVGVAAGADPSF